MLFTNKKKKIENCTTVTINGKQLCYVDNYCYLGIKLDVNYNFKYHYNSLMTVMQDKILLLCKIRPYIDSRTAVIIYKSHMLSYLEYGSIFLDGLPLNLLSKLQRLQNKCLRICHHADKSTSNVDLHFASKLLPLRLRRKSAVSKFFVKKVRQSPELLSEPVRKGNRSSHNRNIKLLLPRTNKFKYSLSYAGWQFWNTLPAKLWMCNYFPSFRKDLNKYMYERYCEDGFVWLASSGLLPNKSSESSESMETYIGLACTLYLPI